MTGPLDRMPHRSRHPATKTDAPLLEVPQTINVVTRKEMDERSVTDFNSAVAYTPGIRAIDYPGGQGAPDIYIRGFRAFGLYGIYKDGLRSGFNNYDLDIEQYANDRIDVLKGPSSVLYGQGSPGGLVNLIHNGRRKHLTMKFRPRPDRSTTNKSDSISAGHSPRTALSFIA